MLTPRRVAGSPANRALQFLPLALAAALLGIMPAKLLPVRPVPMEIPSTIGILPGAAPQQSIPPASVVPAVIAPAPVQPRESAPPASAPATAEPDSAAVPLGAQRVVPGPEAEGEWAARLPREMSAAAGSGNIKIHTAQPTALSALVASIMQSVKRLHLRATAPVKALPLKPPQPKALANRVTPRLPTLAPAPRPNLTGWAIGGALPARGVLGGPATLAARYSAVINGAAFKNPSLGPREK